jgi:hypothetical protein
MFRRNDRVTVVNAHDVARGIVIEVTPVSVEAADNDNNNKRSFITGEVITIFVLPENFETTN